jgi:hypothetical protein
MGKTVLGDKRICYSCGSTQTWISKKGYENWFVNRDLIRKIVMHVLCCKCYLRLFIQPKWNPINNPIYGKQRSKISRKLEGQRRLNYKGKAVYLKIRPRTGICSKCGKSVNKGEITRTHMHHIEYHDQNVLKDTQELCVNCHRIESVRLKTL